MSKHDKKETAVSPNLQDKDTYVYTQDNAQKSYTNIAEENRQSLNEALDETKRNIQRNTDEAKLQIPRYTQSVNDAQEQALQATKDISDNYIDLQRHLLNNYQSVFSPYFENIYNQTETNQNYFRRIPEVYARAVSNYAENAIAASRVFNDLAFANLDYFKNFINGAKEHSERLSEIGKRNIQTYEGVFKDNANRTRNTFS
jgi:hypothetical protein